MSVSAGTTAERATFRAERLDISARRVLGGCQTSDVRHDEAPRGRQVRGPVMELLRATVVAGEPPVLQLDGEIDETLGDDMDDEAFALQPPANGEELAGHHHPPVLCQHLRPDDDIGDAGLVLEGDEDDALGGAGHLPHENEAGDGDFRVLLQARVAMGSRGDGAELGEVAAEEAAGRRLTSDPPARKSAE